jgi:hypothetical protein
MKSKIRLTESDLINLVKRIVKEQEEENTFQEYMDALDHIANEFNRHTTEEELDLILTEVEYVLESAVKDGVLSDDELEELHDYASDLARELEYEFKHNMDLHEGTKAKKPKAMRSRRSGLKTQKTINQNHEVLKKIVKEQLEMDDIEDEEGDEEKEMHSALDRQLRHFDPDDFTVVGRIKVSDNSPAKTPNFILLSNNKTLSGTRLLNGTELMKYVGKRVRLTGVTKNGKHPSFMNPMKVTKKPEILSDNDPTY